MQSVGENSNPDGTRSVNQRSLSLWRKNSVHSVREKKLPCETKKIHSLSVYSIPKISKFKYTIQQPASNPLPTLKIHTLSVYHFSFETQSWHWVVTTATPRMTARDALNGKPQTFEWSMLLDSFDGILRACRREPTRRRKQWRNACPIEIYRHKQDIFEYSLHTTDR